MRRVVMAGAVLAAVLIGAFAAFHDTLFSAALQAAARARGYPLSVRALHVGWGCAVLEGSVVTSAAGEPLLSAQRVGIAFSLPDLLTGRRRFGLREVRVEKPSLTLIHHPDGSYNLVLPPVPANAPPNQVPFDVRVRVGEGRVLLVDRYAVPDRQRSELIDDAHFDGVFSPSEHSYYDAGFTLEDAGKRYPAWGRAEFDTKRGFAAQHWHADLLPIAFSIDFALRSRAVSLADGRLADLDAHAYTFLDTPGEPMSLFASARLQDGLVYASALARPVRDIRGPLRIEGGDVETPGLDATLAGVPLHLVGGVYDVRSPAVRFLLTGEGSSSRLRLAAASTARKAVEGRVAFSSFIEGPAEQPLIFAHAVSPELSYGGMRLVRARASVAVSGTQAYILASGGSFEAVEADGRGWLDMRRHVTVRLLARAHVNSDDVRSLAYLVPRQRIGAVASIRGVDAALLTNGLLWGNGPGGSSRALFRVAASGVGIIGPLEVQRSDGAAFLGVALMDRPRDIFAGIGSLRAPLPRLAGIPMEGSLEARFSAFKRGTKTIVQVSDARFERARLWGVPVQRVAATVGLRKNAIDIYAASVQAAGGTAGMRGSFGNGGHIAAVAGDVDLASLEMPKLLLHEGRVNAAASLRGTQSSPSGSLAVSLSHAAYGGAPLDGQAFLAYADSRMRVEDASLLFAGAYGDASGEVSDPGRAASRLDLGVRVRAVELARIARLAGAGLPYPLRASLDADARIVGSMNAPEIAGEVSVPQGSFNGLNFAGAHAFLSGGLGDLVVQAGQISVGSTQMRFAGEMSAASLSLALDAPRIDAADFNDLFDEGDMLGGHGSAALDVSRSGGVLRGNADARLAEARFRGFALGTTALLLRSTENQANGTLDVSGAAGTMHASLRAAFAPVETVDVAARIGGLDLATWLPAAGLHVPVTGKADAVLRAQGSLDAPTLALRASLRQGLAWRVPIDRLDVALTGDRQRAAVSEAALEVPGLSVRASGTLGIAPEAPFDLTMQAFSSDVGPFASLISGKKLDLRGKLDVDARLQGTRSHPRSNIRAALAAVRVHDPKGTFSGDLTGDLETAGTLDRPLFKGRLALRDAAYASPLLRSPIHGGRFDVSFSETSASMTGLHVEAAGGSLEGSGKASFVDARNLERSASARAVLTARAFRIDAPAYLRGTIDGSLTLERAPGEPALVGGDLAFASTRIPLTALIPSGSSSSEAAPAFPLAFDLGIEAQRDVRVQSGNVDIGARGKLLLGGTLAAPTLSGRLEATGGSMSFYRTFDVQSGILAFAPDTGVIPYVNATATTHISNPDTDILLHASGLATGLTVDFASNPRYSREQILGLLAGAQAFGALAGVPSSSGATANEPPLLQSAAVGYVDQQFTRAFLEPLESSLGSSLGLQNLQLNASLTGEFGGSLSKSLGKGLTLSFAQSYGLIQRSSIALKKNFRRATTLQFAFFSASGAPPLGGITGLTLDPTRPIDLSLLSTIPPAGSRGFTLSYQHKFW
jgi:hypothetical protein